MDFCSRSLAGAFAALLAVGIGSVGCKKASVDAFPPSGAIAGWQKNGDTRMFAAKELYQYIDGDAEQYVAAGVISTSTSDYKFNDKLEATVDVHTMNDAAGAAKIVENGTSKDARPVQIGDAGIAYGQSLIFRKGSHVVHIVSYQSTPDTPQALLALAHGVEAKL